VSFEEFSRSSASRSIIYTLGSDNNNGYFARGYNITVRIVFILEITYNIFLNNARKRRRTNGLGSPIKDAIIFNHASTLAIATPAALVLKKALKGVKKALRTLCKIAGREGLGPINYKELAIKLSCTLNLLEII
jgi:hypothetical protein